MVTSRSFILTLLLALLLTGCVTVTENDGDDRDGPEPTARSMSDGVETWDLTGTPSEAAFGIAEDSRAGIYETDEPRRIVLQLPGGTELDLEARVLTFERTGSGDGTGTRYSIGVRGDTVPPEELTAQLRSIAEQLELPTSSVDDYATDLQDAPADQTERVRYSSPTAQLDGFSIGVQANLAPIAEAGRFIVGGLWETV